MKVRSATAGDLAAVAACADLAFGVPRNPDRTAIIYSSRQLPYCRSFRARALANQALRYTLGLVNPHGIERTSLNPHRALSDAIVTSAIFEQLLKRATWSELVQWSGEPALLTVFGFGKHRGQRFDQAPRDYLEWIADGQNDLREDVKFSARYWLGQFTTGGDS
jgi:hypothetical protein